MAHIFKVEYISFVPYEWGSLFVCHYLSLVYICRDDGQNWTRFFLYTPLHHTNTFLWTSKLLHKNIVNFLPLGLCLSSLFNPTPCISMNTRIILARNHGLSTDECWSPCCAHYWCGPCATYQEALFVEQVYGPFEGPCCLSSLSFGAPFDNSEIDRSWAQRSALEKLREADATNSKFDGRLFGTGLGIDNTEEPLSLWVDDDKAYFTG